MSCGDPVCPICHGWAVLCNCSERIYQDAIKRADLVSLTSIIPPKVEPLCIIGVYYELPDGKIALTFSSNPDINLIGYYFDDGEGVRTVSYNEFTTWKLRLDLKDFPCAKDPRLPFEFDLLFDIKYESQLKQELKCKNKSYIKKLRRLIKKHKIDIGG